MSKIEIIDLRLAEGYLKALEAFESFPDIIEYQIWLDSRSWAPPDAPMEEALDLIAKHTPWLLPVLDRYMLKLALANNASS